MRFLLNRQIFTLFSSESSDSSQNLPPLNVDDNYASPLPPFNKPQNHGGRRKFFDPDKFFPSQPQSLRIFDVENISSHDLDDFFDSEEADNDFEPRAVLAVRKSSSESGEGGFSGPIDPIIDIQRDPDQGKLRAGGSSYGIGLTKKLDDRDKMKGASRSGNIMGWDKGSGMSGALFENPRRPGQLNFSIDNGEPGNEDNLIDVSVLKQKLGADIGESSKGNKLNGQELEDFLMLNRENRLFLSKEKVLAPPMPLAMMQQSAREASAVGEVIGAGMSW